MSIHSKVPRRASTFVPCIVRLSHTSMTVVQEIFDSGGSANELPGKRHKCYNLFKVLRFITASVCCLFGQFSKISVFDNLF